MVSQQSRRYDCYTEPPSDDSSVSLPPPHHRHEAVYSSCLDDRCIQILFLCSSSPPFGKVLVVSVY